MPLLGVDQNVLFLHDLGYARVINGGSILLRFLILLALGSDIKWLPLGDHFFDGIFLHLGLAAAFGLIMRTDILNFNERIIFKHGGISHILGVRNRAQVALVYRFLCSSLRN